MYYELRFLPRSVPNPLNMVNDVELHRYTKDHCCDDDHSITNGCLCGVHGNAVNNGHEIVHESRHCNVVHDDVYADSH